MAEEIDVRSVGTEFVRLYYTMLNEKPECVHLFFTQNSSYIHGGFEKAGEEMPPVRGQAAIRNMIASFNFNDCRTKVLQIDCQETVKKAVLVQVSGELSNNGEPMRRFMQSFVLAPQGPKKYYVHNNIFRYQDEVFADSENLSFDQCEGFDLKTDDIENGTNGVAEETDVDPPVVAAEVQPEIQIAELVERTTVPAEPSPVLLSSSDAVLQMNEVVDDVPQMTAAPVAVAATEEPVAPSPVVKDEEQESKKEPEKETLPQVVPSQKPFSWASLASKNAVAATNVSATAAPKPQAAIKPERKTDAEPAPAPLPQRAPRSTRPETTATESERRWTPGPNDESVGKRSTYPDNQQLFVGNLPHSVTDKELQEFFEQYGPVADVKINRKGPTANLPNFGFVAFETTDAVQKAMKAKPLMLYGKHRINIEEKKDHSELGGRSRMNSRGRGGSYGSRGGYVSRGGRGAGQHTARPTSGGSSGPETQQ